MHTSTHSHYACLSLIAGICDVVCIAFVIADTHTHTRAHKTLHTVHPNHLLKHRIFLPRLGGGDDDGDGDGELGAVAVANVACTRTL